MPKPGCTTRQISGLWRLTRLLAARASAEAEAAEAAENIFGSKPPGWDSSWDWRYPEGESISSPRWFDSNGGEWRWHSPDKWHPEGHWDYNPWTNVNGQ